MRVGEWMTKDPLTVGPKETILLARMIMRQRGIRRLPVLEGDRLVGIVTDRDVREAWASDATTLSAHELHYELDRIPVRDVMTAPVITVNPETPLGDAVNLLREKKIGGLPVLSGEELVGVLTETDIFRAFAQVLRSGNVGGQDLSRRSAPPANKVIVPVLGTPLSQKVVWKACQLAGRLGLRPKVLLILSPSRRLEEMRGLGDHRAFDEIVAGLLGEYRKIGEALGVQAETEFRSGEPAVVALGEIASGDYDFVVAGRRTPLHLGSSRIELEKNGFAARLLEASPVPVLVVSEAVEG